ncbi:MAG: hypothetical protein WCG05_02805 [Alphaproteobacteria bacterium]
MKPNFKKHILIFASFIALNSYGAVRSLDEDGRFSVHTLEGDALSITVTENMLKEARAIVRLREHVREFSVMGLTQPTETQQALKRLFGERCAVVNVSGAIEKLWTSTRIFTISETAGSLGALKNRLSRFENISERFEILKLHGDISNTLLKSLLQLHTQNEELWNFVVKDDYRRGVLSIFGTYLENITISRVCEAYEDFSGSIHTIFPKYLESCPMDGDKPYDDFLGYSPEDSKIIIFKNLIAEENSRFKKLRLEAEKNKKGILRDLFGEEMERQERRYSNLSLNEQASERAMRRGF